MKTLEQRLKDAGFALWGIGYYTFAVIDEEKIVITGSYGRISEWAEYKGF
jgi:hypothetical protein